MKTLAPELLTDEIVGLAKEAQGAFPNDECLALARKTGIEYQSLVSDLDTYFYDVWSAGNGIRKLERKSDAWLIELRAFSEQSFFVRYPQYVDVEDVINPQETPELFRRLKTLDTLRQDVAHYVSDLLGERRSGTLSA